MSGNRIAENNEFSIQNLARSIQAYLEYRIVQDRKYILKESSIDEPFAEYISRYKDSAELECALKYFRQERCDVAFKLKDDIMAGHTIPYYFEFKYTQGGSTRKQDEQQRVFDDLMRLNSIDENGAKTYFLMAGTKVDFFSDFQYFTPNVTLKTSKNNLCPLKNLQIAVDPSITPQQGGQNIRLLLNCPSNAQPLLASAKIQSSCSVVATTRIDCPWSQANSSFNCPAHKFKSDNVYNEMFSFDISNPDKIINTTNQWIADLIDKGDGNDGFKNSYRARCVKKDIPGGVQEYTNFIDKIKHIKTTLQYITHNDSLARVAIWEITKVSPASLP